MDIIAAELGILLGVVAYAYIDLKRRQERILRYLQRMSPPLGLPRDVDAPSIAQQQGSA